MTKSSVCNNVMVICKLIIQIDTFVFILKNPRPIIMSMVSSESLKKSMLDDSRLELTAFILVLHNFILANFC